VADQCILHGMLTAVCLCRLAIGSTMSKSMFFGIEFIEHFSSFRMNCILVQYHTAFGQV